MITNPLAIIALVLATILLVPMVCRKIRIPSIVGVVGLLVSAKRQQCGNSVHRPAVCRGVVSGLLDTWHPA